MKKVLSIILALMMCFSLVTFVGADDGSGKKDVGEHEHQLMDMANAACHYSECTICFELFNVGEHTFVDGKCSVCGHDMVYGGPTDEDIKGEGDHEHILMNNADIASHYEECQVCFVLFNVEDHTFVDGKCSVCGYRELVNPFVDVANDAWYAEDVISAVGTGLVNGKGNNEFKPDDFLTYAEAVKLAACMNQLYTTGQVTLANGEPWYQSYVDYCKEKGIIRTDYNWGDYATRVGYMYIFACALPDEAYKEINHIEDGIIPDVPADAPYASVVYKLYRAGIVTGVDAQHNCNPTANIKRSEVAVIVARMMDETKRIRFDMPEGSGQAGGNTSVGEGEIVVNPSVDYEVNTNTPVILPELEIVKQPESMMAEEYGKLFELEVQVFGGKAPYTYEWYYKDHRSNVTIENGEYAKDAKSEALIIAVEKENPLLGQSILCKITDSNGQSVTTKPVQVFGPFSMPIEEYSVISATKEYRLVGSVADGVLKKGEKVSVIRNGKVIAIGVAGDLIMFEKSLDEVMKGDSAGIVFVLESGATPGVADTVVKYQPTHVLDTSDIIN